MKAVITGVAGFIGSHLAASLLESGHEVTGIDSFTPYYEPRLKERNLETIQGAGSLNLVRGDLNELDLAALLPATDVIFHLAGQPGVRSSWGKSFEEYVHSNISATQRLLEAAREVDSLKRFVYASSSSVYGDAESFPTRETSNPRPVSPYGVTKLAAEHLVMLYSNSYHVPGVALRYFTIFGPRQRPDMAFSRFIRSALDGRPVRIYGDGLQVREFTFVDDCVRATRAAGSQGHVGGIYNVGGGNQASVLEVLDIVSEFTGRPIERIHEEQMKGDARRTTADTTQCRRDLCVVPEVDLREGISRQVRDAVEQSG